MRTYVCDCTDYDEHDPIPYSLYCAVNPDEWICFACMVAYNSAILPSLVDELGINISDLFAPEYQEESE